MVRAALTKLLILVILIFIVCLPDFFTFNRVSKVKFFCLPYRTCERENQVGKAEKDEIGDAEVRRKDMCDPSQTPGDEKWEQVCTQKNQTNTTDLASDSRRGGEDPQMSWFMCETDTDIAELQSNMSSSALTVHLEISVELQLEDAESLYLTLYGRNNHSSLHLHPPEEEEEEEEEKKKKDDEGQREVFYCCLPVPPTSEPANHSRCLLWLANQTALNATAKEKLPWKPTQKDEWRCMVRVLWLVLLCVLLLTIVTLVLRQIDWKSCCRKKPKVRPLGYDLTGPQSNDEEIYTEIIALKGLSPIQEVDSQDELETLLDGNADHCFTGNLHHRYHPSIS
ncbi:uncharacterized protein LOC121886952 isoform X2 [Thunnus maccoyii]|uniref:uncharacterized protein LOC121886952 isoform X2 n=1 Tax=Thunnus maccoyii TaxID=8240 RepID=UPI001C4D2490|nr:uncharacterized protein LOC121886952 isoform X2 [Thunnus maccoyii]